MRQDKTMKHPARRGERVTAATTPKPDRNDKTDSGCCRGMDFNRRTFFGLMVILAGVGLLLQNIFSWFSFNYVWPVMVIMLGIYIIERRPR